MKIKFSANHLLLLLIIAFASFLYFYKLGEVPNSLSDDEATVGYNAFSILKTGKDEFGKTFPIAFRFFGAYTPPLYVYLVVGLVKLFGLNAVSLRVLSGVASLVGIWVTYSFAKKLKIFRFDLTALLAAFVFAISPWVIFYARIGYEVTLGYIVYSLGALFLWRGLAKRQLSLAGLALLSVSTYIAHTERYLVPIFLFFILIFFHREIFSKKNLGQLKTGLVILVLTQAPNLYLATTKAFWVKNIARGSPSLGAIITDFTTQLLTYFSPTAIFGVSSDINLQHTAPELPLFYSWLVVPFLVGLYQLYRKRGLPGGKFLVILFLTAPLPGAFSGHFISIQRVMPLIVPLVLIMALGFDSIIQRIKPIIFLPLLTLLVVLSLILFWRSYWVLFPKERGLYWSYGYEELATRAKNEPLKKFVVDTARAPAVYIGLLFYLQYPPVEYQKLFRPELVKNYYADLSLSGEYKFANFELRPIVWKKDVYLDQILVGDELTISADQIKEHFLQKVLEIKDPNGKAILIGYQTNPKKKLFSR